ncbi:tripartite tricarboxylate transporter TctB family protein [Haloactinomyces albus]|uniref:Tricarboxylic transport membrane protein n=1 Tax=Haloactinomyces albus TaxID=1352928 RepID=A0AAE3ZGH0_9ACTN|nr:tripartite tricarboxylate transporter TctB family protein [Haloactinomyces albus]MDR7304412.1 putative tricarboxylic transport membrane protein [Haloactinomyces albus]
MRQRTGDMVIAGLLLVLAVTMYVITLGFPAPGQSADPGTAAFPRLIAILLAVLSVILLVRPARVSLLPPKHELARVAGVLVLAVAYAWLFKPLGFILATVLFMVGALLLAGVRRPLRLTLGAVGVAAAMYFLFSVLLEVYLPEGIIEGVLL